VVADRRGDLVLALVDRQLGREVGLGQGFAAGDQLRGRVGNRQAQGFRQLVEAARPLRQPAQVAAQARAVGRQAVFEQRIGVFRGLTVLREAIRRCRSDSVAKDVHGPHAEGRHREGAARAGPRPGRPGVAGGVDEVHDLGREGREGGQPAEKARDDEQPQLGRQAGAEGKKATATPIR
jgi:hypothetical protein